MIMKLALRPSERESGDFAFHSSRPRGPCGNALQESRQSSCGDED